MSEDRFEKVLGLLADFATAIEAECVRLKQSIKELAEHELGLKEEIFNILKWNKRKSDKLGEYEVAERKENDSNAFNHAYNILKVNHADIKHHFGSKEWNYYYWIFENAPDLIFRKKRVKNEGN